MIFRSAVTLLPVSEVNNFSTNLFALLFGFVGEPSVVLLYLNLLGASLMYHLALLINQNLPMGELP